jgi:uncharacterized protein
VTGPKRAPLLTLEDLEVWFDKVEPPPHCRDVSMMNAFLTGLAAGPVFLLPNDWLWHVIGEHERRAYIGNKIQAVIDTVVDHYNLIAHQLATPGAYAPVLMCTDEGEVLAGDWADGFFGAIELTVDRWMPLFAQKETGDPAMAILLYCTKPEMAAMLSAAFPKPSTVELKDSWRALPVAVEAIYAHCAPMRFNPAAPANEG